MSCFIVLSLSNISSNVSGWACELQRLVGRAERMRYPDNWSAPAIPHTQYNESHSKQAIELAAKIVDGIGAVINV